jgi:hypothetical protein
MTEKRMREHIEDWLTDLKAREETTNSFLRARFYALRKLYARYLQLSTMSEIMEEDSDEQEEG